MYTIRNKKKSGCIDSDSMSKDLWSCVVLVSYVSIIQEYNFGRILAKSLCSLG